MAYSQPPQYNFGDSNENRPQTGPPAYSPQPQVPLGYGPQPQVAPGYLSQPQPVPGYDPNQPGPHSTQLLQPPPPAASKSPFIPVLIVALIISVAGAILSMALWLRTSSDLEEATAAADDKDAEVAQLEEELAAAEAEAADAETMQACLDDFSWFYETEVDSDEEAEAWEAMKESCADWL